MFPAIFNLSSLNGTTGFAINNNPSLENCNLVSSNSVGDLNNDGLNDIALSAPCGLFDPKNQGVVYVIFGSKSGFTSPFNVSSLNGLNGFVAIGATLTNSFGRSVSAAGDVNGDGIADMVIADTVGEYPGVGHVYVVYGNASSFPAELYMKNLNGANGFVISGVDNLIGESVTGNGDINGDGIADIAISDTYAASSGQVYVIYGSSAGFPATFNVENLNGQNGFVIMDTNEQISIGSSIAFLGDINGDMVDDLGVTAPGFNNSTGQSYVIFGNKTGFASQFILSNLNGQNGFAINGYYGNEYTGDLVSGLGDINGDGLNDLAIGAWNYNNRVGQTYVILGSNSSFLPSFNVSMLNGINGFIMSTANTGIAVNTAGDINGDGLSDIILGAPYSLGSKGQSYVILGSSDSFPSEFNLSTLDGNNGFVVNGINYGDESGFSVCSAGDFNGDGVDDILVLANLANNRMGEAYVIFSDNII